MHFNCNGPECSKLSGDIRRDPQCFSHLINTINLKDRKHLQQLVFKKNGDKLVFSHDDTRALREIGIAIRSSRKDIQHIAENLNQILKKEDNSFITGSQKSATQLLNQNPFQLYTWLKAVKRGLVQNRPSYRNLKLRWHSDITNTINRILKNLQLSTLIKKYDELDDKIKKGSQQAILELLLSPKVVCNHLIHPSRISKANLALLEKYSNPPFEVAIYSGVDGQIEPLYVYSSLMDIEPYKTICANTIRLLTDVSRSTIPKQSYLPIRKVIQTLDEQAQRNIKSKIPEIAESVLNKAAKLAALFASGLGKIMPFLIDPHVNEFYIDGPESRVYLDHERWGRCQTTYYLTSTDLEAIKTRLRLESTQRLDEHAPTLKTELISDQFHVRATMDVKPLAYNGPYLDIRKFYLKSLSVPDLIQNRTLNSKVASFIYFCLINRLNIIAIGEPGSGKTTIINSFDILTPPDWRKITIEDAIESIPQQKIGKHQLRLQVEALSPSKTNRSKTFEITKLLHRSPDYLYLGEIQSAEHSLAMFHALSAGLKGIQTCHGASPEDLLLRWIYHHKVPLPCLSAVDLILFMKRDLKRTNNTRQLVRVCEVDQGKLAEIIKNRTANISELINDLFRRNPKNGKLDQLKDLYNSNVVKKIRSHQYLSKPDFQSQIQLFEQAFTSLCKTRKTNNALVSELLTKITTKMSTGIKLSSFDIDSQVKGLSDSPSYDGKI